MVAPRRSPDVPPPLGVTPYPGGAEVAVLARHADAVELCLFDDHGNERRVPLERRNHGIFWDQVEGMVAGQRYGFRAHGPWDPRAGHRHNPAKLLLDPYAAAVEGDVRLAPEAYGHQVDDKGRGDGYTRDERDSAPFVPRSVVLGGGFDWGDDAPPGVPWSATVIYEAHVRGLTMRHPQVPPELRGTYAALGHPAVVEHLVSLGVTTVELMPVHAFTSEPALVRRGLSNYWGYNTLGFFAPHAAYAAARDPQGVADELKGAVKALHRADIEVLLDVVYNHTCEQGASEGMTLSWRGLDAATYYRLDHRGQDVDVTGCGNTVDLREPMVARMVLDSLRHWVEEYHVDGFRFDLAPALARDRDDSYDRDHAFHVALRTDPVLNRVKLIAEPWDVGVHGWRTGQFPPPFAEWNDRFRDAVRTMWLADVRAGLHGSPGHGVRELATRVAGSPDMFGSDDRGPIASVNYVASHDGFPLADATAYEHKHNYGNGEDNRDGHGDNRSWNHGVEGHTSDPEVLASRARSVRNLLATVLLSPGVPMLAAGDELGRSQGGNNNAYCQDNAVSWVDWELSDWQRQLLADTTALLRLRREHAVLRPAEFPTYGPVPDRVRLRWFTEAGSPVREEEWDDPRRRTVLAFFDTLHVDPVDAGRANLRGTPPAGQAVLLVLHGGTQAVSVTVPAVDGVGGYRALWCSAEHPLPDLLEPGSTVRVGPTSALVLEGMPARGDQ